MKSPLRVLLLDLEGVLGSGSLLLSWRELGGVVRPTGNFASSGGLDPRLYCLSFRGRDGVAMLAELFGLGLLSNQ